jgi:hypothetical protein
MELLTGPTLVFMNVKVVQSLFLSASTEVKKCTTWTVKFVINVLLPTKKARTYLQPHNTKMGFLISVVLITSTVVIRFSPSDSEGRSNNSEGTVVNHYIMGYLNYFC